MDDEMSRAAQKIIEIAHMEISAEEAIAEAEKLGYVIVHAVKSSWRRGHEMFAAGPIVVWIK